MEVIIIKKIKTRYTVTSDNKKPVLSFIPVNSDVARKTTAKNRCILNTLFFNEIELREDEDISLNTSEKDKLNELLSDSF